MTPRCTVSRGHRGLACPLAPSAACLDSLAPRSPTPDTTEVFVLTLSLERVWNGRWEEATSKGGTGHSGLGSWTLGAASRHIVTSMRPQLPGGPRPLAGT